jgi:hypothetical protein
MTILTWIHFAPSHIVRSARASSPDLAAAWSSRTCNTRQPQCPRPGCTTTHCLGYLGRTLRFHRPRLHVAPPPGDPDERTAGMRPRRPLGRDGDHSGEDGDRGELWAVVEKGRPEVQMSGVWCRVCVAAPRWMGAGDRVLGTVWPMGHVNYTLHASAPAQARQYKTGLLYYYLINALVSKALRLSKWLQLKIRSTSK